MGKLGPSRCSDDERQAKRDGQRETGKERQAKIKTDNVVCLKAEWCSRIVDHIRTLRRGTSIAYYSTANCRTLSGVPFVAINVQRNIRDLHLLSSFS